MSLFRARQSWSTTVGTEEEFHHGSLAVGNVDNDPNGHDKVVVGNLQGKLRIYYPHGKEYRVEDLMLEQSLPGAILQLAIGRFLPSADVLALAVLHPRTLAVYLVSGVGSAGRTQYLQLERQYEHALGLEGKHFTACNLATGRFSGVDRDLLCVQSMDGRLQIFEQDSHAFTRRLNDCFLPGPLTYLPGLDTFVTSNAENFLEGYRYTVLAAAQEEEERSPLNASLPSNRSITAYKKVQADWSVNLGETVCGIAVARSIRGDSGDDAAFGGANTQDVAALGEHSLFLLRPQGTIAAQLRLDYDPLALHAYAVPTAGGGSTANLIVTSADCKIFVYATQPSLRLVWAAGTHHPLTAVRVGAFIPNPDVTRGLICGVDDVGHLALHYLGTDPPSQVASALDAKEPDYEAMEEEHKALLQTIRRSRGGTAAQRHQLSVRVQVPLRLDDPREIEVGDEAPSSSARASVRVYLSWSGPEPIRDVDLAIDAPPCVRLEGGGTLTVPSVPGRAGTPLVIPFCFACDERVLPSSLKVTASAAYRSEKGEVFHGCAQFQLPLALVADLALPVKQNAFRFTLETDRDPVSLLRLFDDMLSQPHMTDDVLSSVAGTAGGSVLSFAYRGGAIGGAPLTATVLVSKNAGKYRVQSASLPALWLVSEQLVRRLQSHFEGSVALSYGEQLPLHDFFSQIDEHFACRVELRQLRSEMNDAAQQYRVIERRLLVRFKDRNPVALNKLDVLMVDTHEKLLYLARMVEDMEARRTYAATALSCTAHLVVMLLQLRFGLDGENAAALRSYLAPDAADTDEEGWEEHVDAALTHLFRTSLAKNKDKNSAGGAVEDLRILENTDKLKKRINILCDRLSRGGRLVGGAKGHSDGDATVPLTPAPTRKPEPQPQA
mmetsp:Transcript_45793/g.143249  ORF Transcript_45793/g.143249 Transcript_45793/m.143249 type:complete len:891 (-) Transcript_45793:279-2951(-)